MTEPMPAPWSKCSAEENHRWLLAEFAGLLVERAPESLLDVGCGTGLLLAKCREAGIAVCGLDQAGLKLDALREAGFEVSEGSAYQLPFADRSVDWVCMRHVPHHLEDPARALAEAQRVARTGVLVAEPYFEPSVGSQRGAIALDRFEKRQHRRRGMFHAEVLDLGALLSFLPPGYERDFEVFVQHHLRLRARSVRDFATAAAELLEALPAEHPEHEALAELLRELERLGLSWNGSLCLTLLRR